MEHHTFRLVMVFVLVFFSDADGQKELRTYCIEMIRPCKCKTEHGLIDLTPLDSGNKDRPTFFNIQARSARSKADPRDRFSWNPCTPFDEESCKDAAACQVRDWMKPPEEHTIAIHHDLDFQPNVYREETGYRTLAIFYTNFVGPTLYLTYVQLLCDLTEKGTLTPYGELTKDAYYFTLQSRYACPGYMDPIEEFPIVWIYVLVPVGIVTIVASYCTFGCVFNRVKGKRGWDILPVCHCTCKKNINKYSHFEEVGQADI